MAEIPRKTIFDSLVGSDEKNMFCEKKVLSNEASVETFFINRMLADLGFKDNQIKTKESLSALQVSRGSKKLSYSLGQN